MSGTEIRLFHVGDASSPRQTTVLPFQIDLFCAIHRVGLAGLITVQNDPVREAIIGAGHGP